jgi:hypothetical protein
VASTSTGGDCDLIGSPSATVYLFRGVGLTLDCLFCDCFGGGKLPGLVPPPLVKLVIDVSGETTFPTFKPVREEVGETARVIELAAALLLMLERGEEEGRPEMDMPRVLLFPEAGGGELGGENESLGLA